MLSLLLGLALLAIDAAADPVPRPERSLQSLVGYQCSGGRVVFFQRGSTELDPAFTRFMVRYETPERWVNPRSLIRIESGGDGRGSEFDAELSRRRSEALRSHLISRGIAADRIHIFVGGPVSRGEAGDNDELWTRQGWIAELITDEEYRAIYPPGLIVECF